MLFVKDGLLSSIELVAYGEAISEQLPAPEELVSSFPPAAAPFAVKPQDTAALQRCSQLLR
jgi:hypothetical protein